MSGEVSVAALTGPNGEWSAFRFTWHDLAGGTEISYTWTTGGTALLLLALDTVLNGVLIAGNVYLTGPGGEDVWGQQLEVEGGITAPSWRGFVPIAAGESVYVGNTTSTDLDLTLTGIVTPTQIFGGAGP